MKLLAALVMSSVLAAQSLVPVFPPAVAPNFVPLPQGGLTVVLEVHGTAGKPYVLLAQDGPPSPGGFDICGGTLLMESPLMSIFFDDVIPPGGVATLYWPVGPSHPIDVTIQGVICDPCPTPTNELYFWR